MQIVDDQLTFQVDVVVILRAGAVFGFLAVLAHHVGAYSSRMVPVDGSASDLPTSDDVNHISLMDTSSAKILGDRVIGSLSDVVSQFEVSSTYTTLVYKDAIIKAAPLEYGGIFKYFNNFTTGTPGYVTVDTQTFDASFVRTEHESTISRTMSSKYLQCSWGVFPLNYFLTSVAVHGACSDSGGHERQRDELLRYL